MQEVIDLALSYIDKFDTEALKQELSSLETSLDNESSKGYTEEYINLLKKISEKNALINNIFLINKRLSDIKASRELLNNPEMKDLALEDINFNVTELSKDIETIKKLTQKKLADDDKKAIFEIRPAVGGIEASLFAEELFNSYINYCKAKKYRVEVLNVEQNIEGGINEAIFFVNEDNSYSIFRFESGVHRVQRVPTTESSGRIHTSTVMVAVLPKFEQSDIKIDNKDIRVDVFRSGGPGGQSVNTTDSAVRVTHIPTGITVSCQNSKSQHMNKDTALSILFSKLQEIEKEKFQSSQNSLREEATSTGERSMKIRTYNFPQSRITDHRINKSWFNINEVMLGELDEIINDTSTSLRE